MQQWRLESEEKLPETVAEIIKMLPTPDDQAVVLALHGDLGAGKTTFTQALARHLGVIETVVSPTFVVMKGYETTNEQFPNLVHIDAYRIEDIDEMRVLHFGEIVNQKDTIICIEWAEKISELLPPATVHLQFAIDDTTHTITHHAN